MKATDKHQKIIQAAVKIFARNGFFNSRISEIAKEANVADGTIYLYFNNKYDILISLFEEEMGKIITNMREELAKEENPLKQLEIFSRVHLKIVEENREMAEVLQVEIRQSSKFMKEYRNKKFAEYVNIISSVIKKGQEQGLIREDVMPGILKRAFFGALDEMSRFWILSPQKKYSIHTAAKQISDFFIRGITVSGHDILS